MILATGTSPFETLNQLVTEPGIDWNPVAMFYLDACGGLPESELASSGKYLKKRFVRKVPALKAAHRVNGEAEPQAECHRLGELIKKHPIDEAHIGIGENGTLLLTTRRPILKTKSPV